MEAAVEHRIVVQIEKHFGPLLDLLATLDPLESYALLGNLMVETVARFPPDQRLQLATAWTRTFREAVRDGLNAPP